MAVAPLQPTAASQNRAQSPGRPALRPTSLAAPRLRADAKRFHTRDLTPETLPQTPAKFTGPEDFKAFVKLIATTAQIRKAQAAGPKATLDAAQAAVQRKESEIGTSVQLARLGYSSAKGNAEQETVELTAQVAQATKALDAARHPGQVQAARLRKEIDRQFDQMNATKAKLTSLQADIDAGVLVGPALATAYATIAMGQHSIAATQNTIATKNQDMSAAAARTAPDYDPAVRDATLKLADAEQRLSRARTDADQRVAQMQGRVSLAQHDYEDQLSPLRARLEEARAAYAPAHASLEQARARLIMADLTVTKTQRAMWWAKGFNLGQFMGEQLAVCGQD